MIFNKDLSIGKSHALRAGTLRFCVCYGTAINCSEPLYYAFAGYPCENSKLLATFFHWLLFLLAVKTGTEMKYPRG